MFVIAKGTTTNTHAAKPSEEHVVYSMEAQRFLRVAWMGLKAEAPVVARIDELEQYFETTWLSGSYPHLVYVCHTFTWTSWSLMLDEILDC